MITYKEALSLVLEQHLEFGTEVVPLTEAYNRVLAEEIHADRDFPPFNRATKDGIALAYEAIENGRLSFEITGVLPAGKPVIPLEEPEGCIEIMTGAVVPYETDTVVMYEHLEVDGDIATLKKIPEQGQNIHLRGSDHRKGERILPKNIRVLAAEMGVLATVGKNRVHVHKTPRIALISTGNELVEIDQTPLLHQIRRSNTYSLYGALQEEGIKPLHLHLDDDLDLMRQKLAYLIDEMDVLILSGGVSKGKFDYLPQVLEELGVEKIFHRVAQRPGKPFWFGKNRNRATLVFSFPGNPVSTFLNFYLYFIPWYFKNLGLGYEPMFVQLRKKIENPSDLTIFIGANLMIEEGILLGEILNSSGSGDLAHLSEIEGFVQLDPRKASYKKGEIVPFIPVKNHKR
ncbi:molybdopterin molybdochelatase [Muriicola jejuensis]|uniref:Molybdopterin molybdenumtransferase n=1 Tax=Muriicola jejuensis TaxID=504488 RepID=A0A6P0UDD6_9FLAO|nr:molybdopterin molybdotransferase MoeA [Muriicola jejuensis]NER11281.1 molybdopterin molybdenumtransferase MoeA [Muriicola jejuensis]SMP21784.1 molybdopterin molybdochelatase [Muriicola jejuensis]